MNTKQSGHSIHDNFIHNLDWGASVAMLSGNCTSLDSQHFFTKMKQHEDPVMGELDYFHPLAFVAKLNNAANLHWFQAIRGSNNDGFWETMWVEIVMLMKMNAFDIVPRTSNMHVILVTWVFKIKHFPTGLIRKFKAQFCYRGNLQKEGIDFFDT
eukprot:14678864-Ditylum_brightwellii.AAC.1